MRVGIIGAGMIVYDFLTFAHEVAGMELIAISATPEEEDKLKQFCEKAGIKRYYTNSDDLFTDDEVEVIYVAVPNHLHFMFSKKAIEAGKHVICEKPFTSNLRELEELVALAKEKDVLMIEAVSTHYNPNMAGIKEKLAELGQVKIVSANYSQYSSRYNAFKEGDVMPAFNPEMSGGALMDLNIYNINFVVALFGEPLAVDYQANITRGIDTSGILTLDYGSFKCVCIGAKDCKAPISTTIQGDEGFIRMTTPANVMGGYTFALNGDKEEEVYDFSEGKHRMYHEFVRFVDLLDNVKLDEIDDMLDISLITMKIQTEARLKAGIVFPADE
ncbi:MAG: Gfo/Idh/MocA family oxidoreductase [Turicibacter sp.]|nr:Gfo/Idh/MocA family oxidoreductase [Turicibacter sp.]